MKNKKIDHYVKLNVFEFFWISLYKDKIKLFLKPMISAFVW